MIIGETYYIIRPPSARNSLAMTLEEETQVFSCSSNHSEFVLTPATSIDVFEDDAAVLIDET